jgi:exodeoxyribonuclease V alpha subunit
MVRYMANELTAEVVGVTYFNPVNGYLVARVRAGGEPGQVTVVGTLGQVAPGETLELTGEWRDHPKFGRQFEAETCRQVLPASINGIRRYLASGMIRGVGPVLAGRLVDKFGAEVLDILDADPKRLLAVEGLGRKKLDSVVESWREQREIRDLMLFLQSHEVSPTHAARIFKQYGRGAVQKLQENPYDLAYELRGVGFRTADRMALKLGFAFDSPERVEAAVVFALFQASEQGHLFQPAEKLTSVVCRMLETEEGSIDPEAVGSAVYSLEERGKVKVEDLPEQDIEQAVYLRHFYRYERETAARMHALFTHPAPLKMDKAGKLLPELEARYGIELSDEQRRAVLDGCTSKAFIITGGPGTGKTTITRFLVRLMDEMGMRIRLAAPTGRAAKRLSEATGFSAQTLHRLLQFTPGEGFARNEESKLKAQAVIVDEASMLDAPLFTALLRALPLTCRLVLIGDVNQLPSVGPGNVLADLIESETLSCAVLTHIFRQAQESLIVVNAHRVNNGEFPRTDTVRRPPENDFYWIERDDPAEVRDLVLRMVCERIPETYGLDPGRDVQVLSPMHKGEVGTRNLNVLLQERINPRGPEVSRGKFSYRPGDRVLQLRNNYDKEVFNGDLGFVTDLDVEAGEVFVDFDGQRVLYELMDLDELTPAYAISVHKSQGSEYPAVVVPLVTQHYLLLQRNLIYTALTRARRLCVLIGSSKAMRIGLNKAQSHARYTHLRHRLRSTRDTESLLDA